MAPSVVYIDEAEKVFLSDKKKLKEFGSQVGAHVLVLGSRQQWVALDSSCTYAEAAAID